MVDPRRCPAARGSARRRRLRALQARRGRQDDPRLIDGRVRHDRRARRDDHRAGEARPQAGRRCRALADLRPRRRTLARFPLRASAALPDALDGPHRLLHRVPSGRRVRACPDTAAPRPALLGRREVGPGQVGGRPSRATAGARHLPSAPASGTSRSSPAPAPTATGRRRASSRRSASPAARSSGATAARRARARRSSATGRSTSARGTTTSTPSTSPARSRRCAGHSAPTAS